MRDFQEKRRRSTPREAKVHKLKSVGRAACALCVPLVMDDDDWGDFSGATPAASSVPAVPSTPPPSAPPPVSVATSSPAPAATAKVGCAHIPFLSLNGHSLTPAAESDQLFTIATKGESLGRTANGRGRRV